MNNERPCAALEQTLPSAAVEPDCDGNSNLLRRDGELRQVCAQCRTEIVDGHWFCRLPGSKTPTLLCSPRCALRYFNRAPVERNGSNHDSEPSERRFHFFMNGERQ